MHGFRSIDLVYTPFESRESYQLTMQMECMNLDIIMNEQS